MDKLKFTAWKSKIRCLNTTPPKSITSDRALPTHEVYFISVGNQTMKRLTPLSCLALDIACSYFDLSPTKSQCCDWLTHCSLTNLIGWLFCDVTELFGSAKVGQKFWASCGLPISRPIFVRLCSGKKQCPSQTVYFNISRGNVWPNYPFKNALSFSMYSLNLFRFNLSNTIKNIDT